MRIVVFFDLPVLTAQNLRDYRKFRKHLIKEGFLMVQESVYTKLIQNGTMADLVVENLRKNRPPEGLVQVLRITEKQYAKMLFITGERKKDVLESDERLVLL